ncbi:alpha/beta fold hydrolase [Streptomyces sp. H49]|uniref:alpha/beta fold hydrolase n=1 Tax=Streptomyces sp. H49 TaxID=3444117 RepID=UPI003F4AA3C6
MPALAREHTVVAVDSRGSGLSDKPDDGYDAGTLAADLVALMAALGHDRFDVVGHDIGTWTGYALAADHPERVGRLAIVEAMIPGLTPSPPFFGPAELNLKLWQFGFNRLTDLNEELVRGAGAALLRLAVRHQGRHTDRDPRVRRGRLRRRDHRGPPGAAGEFRVLPGAGRDDRAERAAQQGPADAAGARRRRRAVERRECRPDDAAGGRRRHGGRPRRLRSLPGRGAAGAVHRDPGGLPRRPPVAGTPRGRRPAGKSSRAGKAPARTHAGCSARQAAACTVPGP